MKKLGVCILVLLFICLASYLTFASVGVQEDDTHEGVATDINVESGVTGAMSGGVYTVTADPPVGVTALTAGATVTLNFDLTNVFTLVPGESGTITGYGGSSGDVAHLSVSTGATGTTHYFLVFDSAVFSTTNTLAPGDTASKKYIIQFVNDGVRWTETSRTTAQ